jgi:Phorbol esters/diacylglycerol binding domain (C1 domain)
VIVNDQINSQDTEIVQSPIELSPPETQISTSSLMTTGTLTSSSDKLLNMISPEEGSGVSNLSPSPSPPQSPSVHTHNNTSQSSSLGSNRNRLAATHKLHHNNINNNILNFNGSNRDMTSISSISSIGTSTASNNINNNNNDIEIETSADLESLSKSKSNESQLSINGTHHNHQKPWQNGGLSSSEVSSEAPIPAPRTKYPLTSSATIYQQQDYNDSIHHSISEGGGHSIVTPIIVSDTSAPPRSPCTPVRGMGHMIQHRFSKKFKFTTSTCDLCNKQMFFGFKCTECKYRCHKDCKSNVPPSCGLPKEFVDEFKKSLYPDGLIPNASPNLPRAGLMPAKRNEPRHRPPMHSIPFHGADSSSAGSSCNSSSPSSPALLAIPPQTPANKSQFNFPEVSSSTSNASSSHHVSSFSSYPNTIIEDAENEHQVQQQQQHQHQPQQGHSKINENYMRNNYQHSLTSPNNIDNQIKLNGSIIDSSGESCHVYKNAGSFY